MKVKEITVSNYKKFIEPKTISFCDSEGNVNDMNLLLGENGSGKSSILQAIVAAIAPMTRGEMIPSQLDWNGFEYRLIETGRLPLRINVQVTFSEIELQATQNYFDELKQIRSLESSSNKFTTRPGKNKEVSV